MWLVALLTLTAAAPEPGAARCVVAGRPVHLVEVRVEVAGAEPFELTIEGALVAATIDDAEVARLDVQEPLAFTASVPRAALVLRPRRAMWLAEGRVGVGARTRLDVGGALGDEALVTPSVLGAEALSPVRAPCGSLTFSDPVAEPPQLSHPRPSRRYLMAGAEVALFTSARRDGEPLVVRGAGADIVFERLARRHDSARVRARWDDGTTLEGWLDATAITPFPHELAQTMGGVGFGMCGMAISADYHGPALLRPGARVHVAPDGPAWAVATRAQQVVVIGSSGWVTLSEVPGFVGSPGCVPLEHAYVRAEDLRYPR